MLTTQDAPFQCTYLTWDELSLPPGIYSPSQLYDRSVPYLLNSCGYGVSSDVSSSDGSGGGADWQNLFTSCLDVQIVSKFQSELLEECIAPLLSVLAIHCTSLRSGLSKIAVITISCLARSMPFQLLVRSFPIILPPLITKSIGEKKFVAEVSWQTCRDLVSFSASKSCVWEDRVSSLTTLASFVRDKNALIVARVAMLLELSLEKIVEFNNNDDSSYDNSWGKSSILALMAPILCRLLTEKLPTTKKAARGIVAHLINIVGEVEFLQKTIGTMGVDPQAETAMRKAVSEATNTIAARSRGGGGGNVNGNSSSSSLNPKNHPGKRNVSSSSANGDSCGNNLSMSTYSAMHALHRNHDTSTS